MLTPYQTRKDEEFDFDWEIFSVENTIEKESEEGRMLIQNKCVSSQKGRIKKRRGRYGRRFCRPFCSLPFLSGLTRLSFVGSKAVLQRKSKSLGNTHKIPFISDYRVVASTKFSDIHLHWLSKTDETTNETNKMQMSLRTD